MDVTYANDVSVERIDSIYGEEEREKEMLFRRNFDDEVENDSDWDLVVDMAPGLF